MTQNTTGTPLPPFDGRDVIASSISIRKAGDGLSEALDIDPTAFSIGERVFVVLECEVTAVDHHPIPKAESVLGRKHVLTTETATIIDGALVEAQLAQQRELIEEAKLARQRVKEQEAGVQRVPGTEPWSDGDEDADDLPADGFGDDDDDDTPAPDGEGPDGDPDEDDDLPDNVTELAPPADPADAAWEAGDDEPDPESE